MITSIDQANAVQSKRVAQTKDGVAKAVRRYLLREHSSDYKAKKNELPSLVPKNHQ
jgi:hypothetical protein